MIQISISIDRGEGAPDFMLHIAKAKQIREAVVKALQAIAPEWTVISSTLGSNVLAFQPQDVVGKAPASTLTLAN